MNDKKILIVSDIHGSMQALEQSIELLEKFKADKLVILGDTFGVDANKMVERLNEVADRLEIVKGNNDWYYEPMGAKFLFQENTFINLNGTLAFACHGHKLDDMNLGKYGVKVIMQGHVHRPFIEKRDGVIRFCPGSIASPRFGSQKSFALVEGQNISIYDINFEKIDEINIEKSK